ncbi:MAG: nitroreductase family protein [Clostridium sp.]|nr:nitroreductase family protein [Acetatifactor muris]MCM1526830.1 nitroreductase family protein [Bacteroides sp.]MCM1562970.1 nitroreductase family protein [Clostridium sp.]
MNTLETIKSRRSIRKYDANAAVPREHVTQILEAAMMAPSACNTRPWEFVVVESGEMKEEIMRVMPYARMLATAPVAIVICGRPDLQENVCEGFWPQDCGAAAQNILLAAKELGYGTCWCGCYPLAHRVEPMQKLLDVSSIPFAVIALGKAEESPAAKGFFDETRVKYL